MASTELLGRGRELEEVDLLLAALPEGRRALALTGPAGIGKTTVLREAVLRAISKDCLVLSTQPAEFEQALSFAGLADLLASVPQDVLESLVPLQRHALEVAILRAEPDPRFFAPRAVPAACLSLLHLLADARPIVLAVDDAQWLDTETSESLTFALRRLERKPVGLLVTARLDPDRPETIDMSLPIDRRRDVVLGPLSVAVLQRIIETQTRQTLTRPMLVRIATSCGGNPFYAIEIARELEHSGIPSPGQPLPIPSELQGLVRSRMRRLPGATKDALLVAACVAHPTAALVNLADIGPAEEEGIVTVSSDGAVHFTHPLFAAAVIGAATASRRRAAHVELATRIEEPEARARHLAATVSGPDSKVAAALDDAAFRAASRAASATAVELARQAIELTPDSQDDHFIRRVISFAHYARLSSVVTPDCRERLEAALAVCPPDDRRAELLLAIQDVTWGEGDSAAGYEAALEAIRVATNPVLVARAHFAAVWSDQDDPVRGLAHLNALLDEIGEEDEASLYASALMHRAYVRLLSGLGADDEALQRGRVIEARVAKAGWWDRSPVPVIWPLLKDDLGTALEAHSRQLDWARQVGDAGVETSMYAFLSQIELLRGDLAEAQRWTDMLAEAAQQSGSNKWLSELLCSQASLDAHAGRLEAAVAKGEEALSLSRTGRRTAEVGPRQILGFAALSGGDFQGTVEQLGTGRAILDDVGQLEPAQWRFHPNLVEALLGLGDLSAAQEVVQSLESRAKTFPRPWILAVGARCRAQLRAAAGDLDGAVEGMRHALELHADLEMPYELARSQLAHGQILRRLKERRAARAALEEAATVFERAGSLVWARRAHDELRRIPVRRRPVGLTATEEEVARLASAGLTNKEIAARAFLSIKTVEGNLSRIYLKLGVHSRAELVRVIAAREQIHQP